MQKIINRDTRLKEKDGIVYSLVHDDIYIYKSNIDLPNVYVVSKYYVIDGKKYTLKGIANGALCNCKRLCCLVIPDTCVYLFDDLWQSETVRLEIYHNDIITVL